MSSSTSLSPLTSFTTWPLPALSLLQDSNPSFAQPFLVDLQLVTFSVFDSVEFPSTAGLMTAFLVERIMSFLRIPLSARPFTEPFSLSFLLRELFSETTSRLQSPDASSSFLDFLFSSDFSSSTLLLFFLFLFSELKISSNILQLESFLQSSSCWSKTCLISSNSVLPSLCNCSSRSFLNWTSDKCKIYKHIWRKLGNDSTRSNQEKYSGTYL